MDASNPVVTLCADGMMAEGRGQTEEARDLFARAWAQSVDDVDRCVAAHYLARQQGSPEATFRWNREALDRAAAVEDDRVRGFYPSLYLNMGKSCEDLGRRDDARRYYELAAGSVDALSDDGYGALVRRGIAAGLRRTDTAPDATEDRARPGGGNGMDVHDVAIVATWHRLLNDSDLEGLVALVDLTVEVGGPRGTSRGRQVVRDWFGRAGVQLTPLRYFHKGTVVVVEEAAVWHSSGSGQATGRQVVSSAFSINGGLITRIQRFDTLAAALAESGLDESDVTG